MVAVHGGPGGGPGAIGAAATGSGFSYEEAFSRNLGWVTEWEQQALRGKCVAIAGLGGVGGVHLLTLARLGVGAFRIADLDVFELANFNRQVGATIASLGRPKIEVLAERARQINPELRIACFDRGVTEANLDEFLAGADLFVDSLDFFVLDIRRKVSARCGELGIPVINAAPLGMGTAVLIFQPGGMTFEQWFRLDGLPEEHQYVNYLVGMAPSGLHRGYLVDPARVDLRGHRGPSTAAACELCAGVAAVEALKLLLRRGRVRAVPYYQHFDAYRGRWVVGKLRGGNRHPVQRLKIALTRRFAARMSRRAAARDDAPPPATEIEKILDLARWAPSGDNVQPWRFEIVDDETVVVHLTDQTDHDLYDYRDGEPTLLAGGMLLESMRIAASAWGRGCDWHYQGREGHTHRIRVSMPKAPATPVDPLLGYLTLRSVDRRPYRLRKLTQQQKQTLADALGDDLEITWYETLAQRWRFARLGARATAIRLTIPEAFPLHQRVIDWENAQSPTGIPAAAAGFWRISLGPMRWAMRSWPRMRILNMLGGVFAAQVQMDYLPGVYSAAFFAIRPRLGGVLNSACPTSILNVGQGICKFWLTITRLGLAMQPGFAPLIFAQYGRDATRFTTNAEASRQAHRLSQKFAISLGSAADSPAFFGRIGSPCSRLAVRSTRRRVIDLLVLGFLPPGQQGREPR